jgi:hypothetical protein
MNCPGTNRFKLYLNINRSGRHRKATTTAQAGNRRIAAEVRRLVM